MKRPCFLKDRIAYVEGNALETEWPQDEDVVLMSYLLSGIPGAAHDRMIDRAWQSLAPGGRILIHDFVVEGDRTGPKLAALWQLQHTAFTPEARSVDAGWVDAAPGARGLEDVAVTPTKPEKSTCSSAG